MSKTTIGIIGCGYWGPNLVRNFHGLPNVSVKTVSDLRPGRLSFINEQYSDIGTTDDYLQILNDPEIDAVAVVTPVTTHRNIAEEALRAGKHVFVEKPLAHTAADAWDIVTTAGEAGRVLAVGHIFQYAPGVRRAAREISAGRLGKIHHISSTRINLGPPNTTVDVVWDLAPHDLSIIMHWLGQAPVSVSAHGASYRRDGHVDNAHIDLEFPSGCSAHIHVSWLSANKTRTMQVFGDRGSIIYDEMLALDGKVKLFDTGVDNRTDAGDDEAVELAYSAGDLHILHLEQHEPLRMECLEFVKAVRTGCALPNDGAMGARVVEVLEQISAQIGAPVTP